MSKHLRILIAVLVALFMAAPAMAMKFEFHGDLNNRFVLYTDQAHWFQVSSPVLDKDDRPDSFGEIKSRLIASAATDDGAVKGVYAIEVGAVKFGQASRGGSYSGDGVFVETRWFYTDFQIPSVASKARIVIGLFSNEVNRFFWSETIMGVKLYGDNWYVAWLRPKDSFQSANGWGENDVDSLNARYDLKMDPVKLGIFASYFTENPTAATVAFTPATQNEIKLFPDANFDVFTIGVDGGFSTGTSFGKAFVNWDLIYQTGTVEDVGAVGNDLDINDYLLHADLGLNFGKATVTYTVWYASGDDNSSDRDLDNFFSVDVDFFDSMIFQEGLADDNAFFEGPYVRDKGMFFHKLALDYAVDKKTKLGVSALYLRTAEDLVWSTFREKDLGVELQGYGKYKIYDNLELTVALAYLSAGDAMDFFETSASQNGKADVDIFKSEARVRFQF